MDLRKIVESSESFIVQGITEAAADGIKNAFNGSITIRKKRRDDGKFDVFIINDAN